MGFNSGFKGLNGFVRLAERRNLVSARVPSHFKRSLTRISNFIKIRPMGAEMFHVDGQADMTKLTVAFRNFVNAPKYSIL